MTGTNLTTDRVQSTRSNAPTATEASYIGETGRNLDTRLTEHKWATRNGDANNHIAVHHQLTNHNNDWDICSVLNLKYKLFSTTVSGKLVHPGWGGGGDSRTFSIGVCREDSQPWLYLRVKEGKTDTEPEKWHPIQGTQTTANVHE